MTLHIGISPAHLQAVASEMQKLLADEYVLYTKTRNYHRNVEGPQFTELHMFYESQDEAPDKIIDDVAQQIRWLGH